MVFQPGQSGNPAGREKGSVNRINIDIRQKFYKVYDNIGKEDNLNGDESFRVWARSNKKTFYSLFCKLAPTNLNITDNRQHESFIDRMAVQMLEAEAKVIDTKVIDTKSQLDMGQDTIISPSNGGHMGTNDSNKDMDYPINEQKSKKVVSDDI